MNIECVSRMRSGPLSLGTWLSSGSSVIAELAAECGFDWLLFDLEHGTGSEGSLLSNLQAVRGSRSATIVRVGAPNPDLIARVLDWGADGIMVPHVASAAEAEACVQATRYAPRGQRGISRTVRAYRYGLTPPDFSRPITPPIVMAQIETAAAVEEAEKIARIEGVDVLFVGPGDLEFDLASRQQGDAEFQSCVERVALSAATAGKISGILARNSSDVTRYRQVGFGCIALESDINVLRKEYRRLVDEHTVLRSTLEPTLSR